MLALDAAAQELLFRAARTSNTFSDEPVSDEQLRAITDQAKWPPTMANTNPLRILSVRTAEAKERLGPLMSEGNRTKTLTAPAVAVLAVDTDFHDKIAELLPFRPELRDNFVAEAQNRERLAIFNGALETGYFILAVRAAGLAAGPMLGLTAPASIRSSSPAEHGRRSSWSTSANPDATRSLPGCRGWLTMTTSSTPSGRSSATPSLESRIGGLPTRRLRFRP